MDKFEHYSVLLEESIKSLNIKNNGIYIDCTFGGGGHSSEISKKLNDKGMLICVDRDIQAINLNKHKVNQKNTIFIHDNFSNIKSRLEDKNIYNVHGAIMDLGVSSYQLDNRERGFSYHDDAKLDMRMNTEDEFCAYDVVNSYSEENLAKIIFKYGEEKFSRSIARNIVKAREEKNIETTSELVDIISNSVPASYKKKKHPARKTFQAIRMEVNKELESIEIAIADLFEILHINGRIAVITFHSLEDRIVKNIFKEFTIGCTCPKNIPICMCNKLPRGKLINRKVIIPKEQELSENNRSRSAKLRILEKINE